MQMVVDLTQQAGKARGPLCAKYPQKEMIFLFTQHGHMLACFGLLVLACLFGWWC